MTDQENREKVIKGMEHCIEKLDTVVNKTHGFNCIDCPYFRKCDRSGYLIGLPLMRDALALLKAQEPVEPILKREGWNKYHNYYVCPICDNELVYEQNYCSECGSEVKWE